MKVVDEIQTQGNGSRWDNSQLWVSKYKLAATQNGKDWHYVNGGQEFTANSDTDSIVVNKLQTPVRCLAIRICPTAWNYAIALRCEIYCSND